MTAPRTITTPLRSLAAATHELAAGNFDLELPLARRSDEVGLLVFLSPAAKDVPVEQLHNHIREGLRKLKMMGFTDKRLATLTGRDEGQIRRARRNRQRSCKGSPWPGPARPQRVSAS